MQIITNLFPDTTGLLPEQALAKLAEADKKLQKWAGSGDATVHRIETLNVAPKKWKDGKLENVVKTSNIISSVVKLYGVSDTHYIFRLDLTSLLGFSYKGEKQMKTGVSFKLAKSCFDNTFHSQVNSFLANFTRFVEWRASQWENLLPHTSKWSQENQKTAPGIYFNKDTAFNGTLCSWYKVSEVAKKIEDLNLKGIDKNFLNSCIVPSIQFGKFALAYEGYSIKVNGTDVFQQEVKAFDYKELTIETFSGGGAEVTDKKGTADLFALMSEEPDGGNVVKPEEPKTEPEYVVVDGVAYPVGK